MSFDPYKLIKYHLYLLQLENYEPGRFWKLLFKRGWFPPSEQRKDLVWTKKAVLLLVLTGILILLTAGLFCLSFEMLWQKLLIFLLAVYVLSFLTPIFLSIANIILGPFDWTAKKIIVRKARSKIKSFPNLKVIGIAGSYGKTTMKDVLAAVLSPSFKIAATPESVNTPVGIARWVLNKVDASTQIIIVEMGEHYNGDVKELCGIARPDIAVVTGINESHLERLKTLDNVVSTIFEIVSAGKPGATVLLNADDEKVSGHYKEFVWPDHKVEKFGIEDFKFKTFNQEKLLWESEADGIGKFEVNLLGEYALADISAAIKIAQSLGMAADQIKRGIAKVKPIEHRLQALKSAENILIIDDAYNGNPAGVNEAIKVLSRFSGRRKIYITPGLVEMGKSSEKIHREIGARLAQVADVAILLKNSVTPFIAEGLEEARGNRQVQITWFDTAQEAHSSLGKILKSGDVVLFQNDWGDNYM